MVVPNIPLPILKYLEMNPESLIHILEEYPFYHFPKIAQILDKHKLGGESLSKLNYFGLEEGKLNKYAEVYSQMDLIPISEHNNIEEDNTPLKIIIDNDSPSIDDIVIDITNDINHEKITENKIEHLSDEIILNTNEANEENVPSDELIIELNQNFEPIVDKVDDSILFDIDSPHSDYQESNENLTETIKREESPSHIEMPDLQYVFVREIKDDSIIDFINSPKENDVEKQDLNPDTNLSEQNQPISTEPSGIELVDKDIKINQIEPESTQKIEENSLDIDFIDNDKKTIPIIDTPEEKEGSTSVESELEPQIIEKEVKYDFASWLNNFKGDASTPTILKKETPKKGSRKKKNIDDELSQNIDIHTIEHTLAKEIDSKKEVENNINLAKDDELEGVLKDKFFVEQLETKKQTRKTPVEIRIQDEAMNSLSPLDIATETMAILNVQQGNISKAIEIYQKLIELIPEKSSFFATQIEKLKK